MDALPGASAPASPEPGEVERELELVRTGVVGLADVMVRAQRWQQQGSASAAAELYEAWIDSTESGIKHVACFNWGTVLGAIARHVDAERAYHRALSLDPGFARARLNLGHTLESLGRKEEALAQWRQVDEQELIDSDPHVALGIRLHALKNLARLLEQQGKYDQSERTMRRSLELEPNQPDVIQHYVHIRQKQCEWPVYQTVGRVTQNQLLVNTSALAMLSVSDDPALQLMAARSFVSEKVQAAPKLPLFIVPRPTHDRIRVGYLSGDFCMHAVGLLIPELLELHDRSRFEVFGFCWSREDGTAQRQRLIDGMDHHIRLAGMDDAAAALLIAQCGIDVLVDLQGITDGARPGILARRPAPVQVGYLGLPATSALPGVDYLVADRFVMPEESLPYYTERPLYLPHCYQVSDRKRGVAGSTTRAAQGLPEGAFVLCSFNNNHKFTQAVFEVWMRILTQVDGSVLWLLADNEWARENMLQVADANGVARERLVFAPRVSPAQYLARFALADLFLDTFPYNAGTTASDALWMGVPIITLSGRTYISRMAGSLLTHVGLPDLVTTSLDDYERLAVQVGRNPSRVASYKRYLAEHGRDSVLFDIPRFVRGLESEFERLVLEHPASQGLAA